VKNTIPLLVRETKILVIFMMISGTQ